MRRALAVVAAVAMVVGSLAFRSHRDHHGAGKPSTPSQLVCVTELQATCTELARAAGMDLLVEDAGVTADRLATSRNPPADVWLAPKEWPGIVDATRRQSGLDPIFTTDAPVLGRTRIAVLASGLDGCNWRCIGDRVGKGSLRLGWRAPDQTAFGLLTVGAATVGYFGHADVATNDFDPAFTGWVRALVAGAVPDPSPVERILQSRAFFPAAATTDAEALPLLATADPSRKNGLHLLYPEPVATVDVVLARPLGAAPAGLTSRARAALAAAGWRPQAAGSDGLPDPGVLTALRQEVSR